MSQQGPLPYLSYCGVEVANAARTVGYLRNGLGDTTSGRWELGPGDLCSVLYRLGGGSSHGVYVSPAVDPAPWYDATEPGSRTFLGLIMLGLTGYDSTITRQSAPRIVGLGGGTFGAQHRQVREWKFRAALVQADDAGAEFGLRWLTSILEASSCSDCATCDLTVRIVCPPDNGSNDTLGEWTSYEVALVDGPNEVVQFVGMPEGGDVLAGCRDYTIVEWTMQAGNPFLYKRAVSVASAAAVYAGGCSFISDMTVFAAAGAINDATRAANVDGDGLPPTDSSYGLWEQTNNQFPNGGGEVAVTATDWNPTGTAAAARTTAQHKFGIAAVDLSTLGSVPDEGVSARTRTALAYPAGTALSMSVWLKGAVGGELVALRPTITNTDTTTTSGTVVNAVLTTEWQRFEAHVTVAIGKTGDRATLFLGSRVGVTALLHFYADGLQIEVSPIVTPYVEANGTPGQFRSACSARNTAFALSTTQGWVGFRVRPGWDSTLARVAAPLLWRWQQSATVYMELAYNVAAARWELKASDGVGTDTVFVADTFSRGDLRTLVASWGGGLLKLSLNGAAFATVAYAHQPAIASTTSNVGGLSSVSRYIDGDVKWYGASRYATLSDAQAALLAGYVPFDPSPADLIGVPTGVDGETMTWLADDLSINTYTPNGICDFLFGDLRPVLCEAVTTPARGTVGAVFTLASTSGFGSVVLQAWPTCQDKSGSPSLELEVSSVPAGGSVVVNSATHTVTVTDADGNVTDGGYLLQLPDGRGLEWIESADCDTVGCFCAAVLPCAFGDLTVTLQTQAREG